MEFLDFTNLSLFPNSLRARDTFSQPFFLRIFKRIKPFRRANGYDI